MLARSNQFINWSTLFLLFLLISSINGDDDEDDSSSSSGDDEAPKSCYKYTTDFLKSTVDTLLTCVGTKFKPRNIFEYGTRFYCIIKCVLQELGTVDPEGRFDDIAAAFFFEETFAPEVQETLLPPVQACFSLAEQFDNKDYWCKTYQPFSVCLIQALVPAFLPFAANCFTSPIISIVFSAFTAIAPNPIISPASSEELKRMRSINKTIKCLDYQCTKRYKIEKINGTSSIIVYDRNMTEISRQLRPPKRNNPSMSERVPQIKRYNYRSDRRL